MSSTSFVDIEQATRGAKTPRLRKGQIIAFRISPDATALEYDNVLVYQSLQGTYKIYLGVVKSSMIIDTPSVVDGYAPGDADGEVELIKIAYIGTQPPDGTMMENKELVQFLPKGSLASLSIPILPPHSSKNDGDSLAHHRPPLQLKVVDGGVLPVELGFVHTSFAVNAHLATLHTGIASLELAAGESSRLAASSAADTTEIGRARARLHASHDSIAKSVLQDGGKEDYGTNSEEAEARTPAFTHVAIDVWTDLTNIGPIGEPADFRVELAHVASAVEKCYDEEIDPVERRVSGVHNDSPPKRTTFGTGIILAVSAGFLGPIFGRLVQLLRR